VLFPVSSEGGGPPLRPDQQGEEIRRRTGRPAPRDREEDPPPVCECVRVCVCGCVCVCVCMWHITLPGPALLLLIRLTTSQEEPPRSSSSSSSSSCFPRGERPPGRRGYQFFSSSSSPSSSSSSSLWRLTDTSCSLLPEEGLSGAQCLTHTHTHTHTTGPASVPMEAPPPSRRSRTLLTSQSGTTSRVSSPQMSCECLLDHYAETDSLGATHTHTHTHTHRLTQRPEEDPEHLEDLKERSGP